MSSVILRTASQFLITLLLLYSIFLLIRGHNFPGGGFVGGLVAAGAWSLHAIAFGPGAIRKSVVADPPLYIGLGLLLALCGGFVSAFSSAPFLTGIWVELDLGYGEPVALGTPLLFDLGVYFAVLGVALTVLIGMEEEQ